MPRKFKSDKDRRLQKKYGITEDEWDLMLSEQNGVCKICGKPPTGRALHTDHDHHLRYYKIKTIRTEDGWLAKTDDTRNPIALNLAAIRKLKSEAIQEIRRQLLKLSIRGLVGWDCNSLLRWGKDDPDVLRKAADYLDQYNQKLKETGQENAR